MSRYFCEADDKGFACTDPATRRLVIIRHGHADDDLFFCGRHMTDYVARLGYGETTIIDYHLESLIYPKAIVNFGDSYARCKHHGNQLITESGSNRGYVGEGVWWASLACGDQLMDSGDVEDWMIR